MSDDFESELSAGLSGDVDADQLAGGGFSSGDFDLESSLGGSLDLDDSDLSQGLAGAGEPDDVGQYGLDLATDFFNGGDTEFVNDGNDGATELSTPDTGQIEVDYNGSVFDAGAATLDVDGDGDGDAAVQDTITADGDAQVEYYLDSDDDGQADQIVITDSAGDLISNEVDDGAGGFVEAEYAGELGSGVGFDPSETAVSEPAGDEPSESDAAVPDSTGTDTDAADPADYPGGLQQLDIEESNSDLDALVSDTDGDGVDDTVVQIHDGNVVWYSDTDGDGLTDDVSLTDGYGDVLQTATLDEATGAWIEAPVENS